MDSDERRNIINGTARLYAALGLGKPRGEEALAGWVKRNPRHRMELLEQLRLRTRLRAVGSGDWDEALRRVRERNHVVTLQPEPNHEPFVEPTSSRVRRVRLAAFVVASVVVCSFFALLLWQALRVHEYTTGKGEWRTVQLVDGSLIKMNCQSAMRVRYTARARDIELVRGEALFSVTHDARRPFRVRSEDSIVQAVGTEFDVRRDQGDLDVRVTSGRVALSVDSTQPSLAGPFMISAGQAAFVRLANGERAVELRTMTAQERRAIDGAGLFQLNGESLKDIVSRFNGIGEQRIVIDDVAAENVRIGGVFRADEAERFMRALPRITDLEVSGPDRSGAFHVSSKRSVRLGSLPRSPLLKSAP